MLPVIALAFYITFIPHQSYLYPIHVDEWVHMARSVAILQAADAAYFEPFSGGVAKLGSNLEVGFQLFWGVFHQISGISWPDIFRYFPGIIFIITVLSVYVLAQRQGFGWEAALFACLIPTTVGILGPAFLVPVAMGLLFMPLALFLAFNFRSGWSYFVLFLFTSFLLAIHAPSAICVVIALIPYILLNLKGNFKHSLGITLAMLIPFLAPFPWIFSMLLPTARGLLIPQPLPTFVDFPHLTKTYGYLPFLLCLLGIFLLWMRGGKRNHSLILGLLGLGVMIGIYFTFNYGLHILYTRALMYTLLLVSVMAGAGLAGVENLSLPTGLTARLKVPSVITQNLGRFLCLVLVGVVLALGIPDRQETPYYHMIDEADYRAFVWVRENVDKDYKMAILDPWKGTAFSAITGRSIYTRIHSYPMPRDEEAREFLDKGCSDTAFLRKNGISIVYTLGECRNPDLTEVSENIYLLKAGE